VVQLVWPQSSRSLQFEKCTELVRLEFQFWKSASILARHNGRIEKKLTTQIFECDSFLVHLLLPFNIPQKMTVKSDLLRVRLLFIRSVSLSFNFSKSYRHSRLFSSSKNFQFERAKIRVNLVSVLLSRMFPSPILEFSMVVYFSKGCSVQFIFFPQMTVN